MEHESLQEETKKGDNFLVLLKTMEYGKFSYSVTQNVRHAFVAAVDRL